MGLVDEIRRFLGPKCTKWVHYDAPVLRLQGVKFDLAGIGASLGGTELSRTKLRAVPDAADALDTLEFNWCQSEKDPYLSDERRADLAWRRVTATGMITGLRLALDALQANPGSKELQGKVDAWVGEVQRFLRPRRLPVSPGPVTPQSPQVVAWIDTGEGVGTSGRSFSGGTGGGLGPAHGGSTWGGPVGEPMEVTTDPSEPGRSDLLKLWSHLGLGEETLADLASQLSGKGRVAKRPASKGSRK